MSIRLRLIILFAVSVLAFWILGYYATSAFDQASNKTKVVHEQVLAINTLIQHARVLYSHQVKAWKNVLLRGHLSGGYHKYLNEYYSYERKTRQSLQQLYEKVKIYPSLNNFTQLILKSHLNAGKQYRRAIIAYSETETEAHFAADRLLQDMRENPAEVLDKLSEILTEHQTRQLQEIDLEIRDDIERIKWLSAWLALLLLLLLFWIIELYIGKPLQNVLNVARNITSGKQAGRVKVSGKDEFSIFGRAFNLMLDSLDSKNRELGDKVFELEKENQRRIMTEAELQAKTNSLQTAQETIAKYTHTLEMAVEEKTRELINSEAEFRSAFESAAHSMIIIDPTGHIERFNQAFVDFLEAPSGHQLRNMSIFLLLTPRSSQDLQKKIQILLTQEDSSFQVELEFRHITESVQQGLVSGVLIYQNNKPLHCILQVISLTSLHKAEQEKLRLHNQLQHAQKMEAIGQLTGGIAHDFNNMLASILGYAQLAESQFGTTSDKLKRYLEEIVKAGKRASNLVQQMLAFSRGEGGKLQSIAPEPVVKEVVNLMRATISSSMHLKVQISEAIPNIQGDAVQLHQVIMNLIINSRDAMHDKGTISLAVHHSDIDQGECSSCHSSIDGSFVEVSVADTGEGIPGDIIDRIFDPFFSTKAVGKGSGMGLAMVHGIVHSGGGHLIVESEIGKGTTIRLIFPVAKQEIAAIEATDVLPSAGEAFLNPVKNMSNNQKSILVVDDEPAIAEYLEDLLGIQGYETDIFMDSHSALESFKNNPQSYQALITDQTMPELTGLELATLVHGIRPDLPIILCSGYSEQLQDQALENLPVDVFLDKPLRAEMLLDTLGQLLAIQKAKVSADIDNDKPC